MAQVFLSYSHQDRGAATRVRDFLTRQSVQVWQDTEGIRGGELFDERIKRAIGAAGFLVVIVSGRSATSEYVAWEVRYALELRLRGVPLTVVPLQIDDSEPPDYLARSLVLRLQTFDEDELQRVLTAIHAERVRILLENEALRITVLRRGARFDDETQHPMQVQLFASRRALFVVMMQSVGPAVLATEATRVLKMALQHFFDNVGALVKVEGELHPDVFFRQFFELLNGVYRQLLAQIGADSVVLSDLTLAMFAGGNVFMRNAGASCGLVKRFVGMHNETEQAWAVQMMTGNVSGELNFEELFDANVLAYPIGRYSRIIDASPLVQSFDTPGSVVALANFKLSKDAAQALAKDTIGLDALHVARSLIEMRVARQAVREAPATDSLVVTIECLAPTETFLSDTQERELRQRRDPAPQRRTSVPQENPEDLMVRGQTALNAGDWETATAAFEAARAASQRIGDMPGMARAILNLGAVEGRRDRLQAAAERLEEAHAIATRIKDLVLQAHCLCSLGATARRSGDFESALRYYTRALPLTVVMGDNYAKSTLLNNIGMTHSSAGDHESALQYFREAMRGLDSNAYPTEHVSVRSNAAWELHHHLRRSVEAGELWQQAVATMRKHRLPFAAHDIALIQIQRWYEETQGVVRSEEEYERVVRETAEFAAAGSEGASAVLKRTEGRLLTGLAEAVLEQMLFGPDLAEHVERLEAAIARLRQARQDGIETTYREP